MLAIWYLVPLPFLKAAWTSGSSRVTYCWSVAWRILSITLLACEMREYLIRMALHSRGRPVFEPMPVNLAMNWRCVITPMRKPLTCVALKTCTAQQRSWNPGFGSMSNSEMQRIWSSHCAWTLCISRHVESGCLTGNPSLLKHGPNLIFSWEAANIRPLEGPTTGGVHPHPPKKVNI